MREIKFRVWNTLDKCYVDPKNGVVFFPVLQVAMKGSKYYEAYQFTVLKVSKGVEI